ncbi:thiolase family protein [Gordonia rhizosphera]|uniref:propanoyl-CoA C-acyltransferase n=1 Tax=Gordonia rhizosphera NBRC 16068 TaxID=1108045 RepID=K6WGR7_9ACTN|nr:thiolase family protein [Gordonia rhizosphera]GAB92971.1 putative acetyl-CoA acyltransferase [Gordonia rhizosphera NBRC 16068]
MTPEVVIAGVGTSGFGKQEAGLEELAWQAISEALDAAGTDPGEIDAVVVGTVFSYPGVAHRVLRAAGIAATPIITVENACASGTLAAHTAIEGIRSGTYTTVLALGIEKMSDSISGAIPSDPGDADGASGLALPAMYAMTAQRYRAQYGVTPEELAAVSVKNHEHAIANPRAQYSGSYSVDDVLDSRMIADPLTLLQCSPISDGAAAAVFRAGRPTDGPGTVKVLASALESGSPWPGSDGHVWNYELIQRTAQTVYSAAAITPEQIDVFEIHDAFTIGEIVTIEALGICPPGTGAKAAVEGTTWRGGRAPVNPSGGLLSRGHPLGATGMAQVAEIFWQLTGRADKRQLTDPRIGVVETMGGNVTGLNGNGCVVIALSAN